MLLAGGNAPGPESRVPGSGEPGRASQPGTMAPGPGITSAFLTDFGLAKSVATGSRLTRTGQALGTPAYMAPEQARGEIAALTSATDVWSLGCVLYEMLAGRPAFGGSDAGAPMTPAAVVWEILARDPLPIRRRRPDAPRGLEKLLRACLEKRPARRPSDAAALRDDCERLLRGEAPLARVRRGWRGPSVVAAGVALAAAGAALLPPRALPEAAAPPAPARAEAEAIAARARGLRDQDPSDSARLLGLALEGEPGRHDWRLEAGLLLWAAGRGDEARAEWRRIPASAPEAARARFYAGLEALFRREEAAAAADLSTAARGGGREERLARAALHVIAHSWAEARAALEGEAGWEASFLRGHVEGTDPAGDLTKALAEYDRGLRDGIPFEWVFLRRGNARQALGDPRGAIEDYDAAHRLRPEHPTSLYNRGNARRALGDLRGALRDYDAAIQLWPQYADALVNRAAVRHPLGDIPGALADLDQVLRIEPGDPDALSGRGALRSLLGDPEGALRDIEAALEARPGDPDVLINRAFVRESLGDLPGALEDYDAALRARPGDPQILQSRGSARRAAGDARGALEDQEAALRARPDDAGILSDRGAARSSLGDLRGAIADYDAALLRQPDNFKALNNRALARRKLGDLRGALADLEAAVRIRANYAEGLANLGLVRLELGDSPGAVAACREYLRLAPPGHRRTEEVRRRLVECEAAGR